MSANRRPTIGHASCQRVSLTEAGQITNRDKLNYTATFRSLFGDVPIRIRRLSACPCQGTGGAKSFAAFDLEAATVAPELAYDGAVCGAGTVWQGRDLLSELLPVSRA